MPEKYIVTVLVRGETRYVTIDAQSLDFVLVTEREKSAIIVGPTEVAMTKSIIRSRFNVGGVSHEQV